MPEAEQQLHKLRASMDHETWEELSQENELRSKFRKFKTSDNIINQIILSRIVVLLKEKYLRKFTIVHAYNDKGVISCAMACERKPLDIAIWCPDEQAIMGNIAYQILLCQQHGDECRKNTALLNIFVEKIAKPFWIESGLGLDMSEFIVFSMMLKKLTNGEYWILIFDTKRFFRINEKLLKYYNHAAHEDYIVCPTRIFNLNTPPSDTIFIITAKKSIMSTEQLEANVDKEDLQFSQKYIDDIVSKFKDVKFGNIPCQHHQLAIKMANTISICKAEATEIISGYNTKGELYPLPVCSYHDKECIKWSVEKFGGRA